MKTSFSLLHFAKSLLENVRNMEEILKSLAEKNDFFSGTGKSQLEMGNVRMEKGKRVLGFYFFQ
jgi:poly(3-hydroxyalkanoate) synthetase